MDLTRIETKLDKVSDDITDIKVTMTRNTATLEEHVRRTDILEKKVQPMWTTYKIIAGVISLTFLIAAVVEIMSYYRK